MQLLIILICHLLIGFSIVDWVMSVLPKFWEDKFKENALEADELQDTWYEYEHVIYFLIVVFGSFLAVAMLAAKAKKSVKRFFKPKQK